MHNQTPLPWSRQDLSFGKQWLEEGKVGEVSFSSGTYQVEVRESTKKVYWPLLQIDDQGTLLDGLCNCEGKDPKSCPHLAAAYFKIAPKGVPPLHVRFLNSFWNHLGQIAYHRHGGRPQEKKKEGTSLLFCDRADPSVPLVSLNPLTPASRKTLKKILCDRPKETEETSIKFSNLSPEELSLWKQGRAGFALLYELSFWSDLAKWWLHLQEEGEDSYSLSFSQKGEALPSTLLILFPSLSLQFTLQEEDWEALIPSLSTIRSPLQAHPYSLQAIHYNPEKRAFLLQHAPHRHQSQPTPSELQMAQQVGNWLFVPQKGFFPKTIDPLFQGDEISEHNIPQVLSDHLPLLTRLLTDTSLHLLPLRAQYQVSFDAKHSLHIRCYALEPNDLHKPSSVYFGDWVYVEALGFYQLENQLFHGIEQVIPFELVGEFINSHKSWLSQFPGLQTHVSTIESQLTYHLDSANTLHFTAHLESSPHREMLVDFGDWIYLKESGFFAKRIGLSSEWNEPLSSASSLPPPRPLLQVSPSEIHNFIRTYYRELEGVRGFFAHTCPLETSNIRIFLNAANQITIRPYFTILPAYRYKSIEFFGDFTHVTGEGFFEIPPDKRLPDGYNKERTISAAEESFFLSHELDRLRPFALSIQTGLQTPSSLSIQIQQIQRHSRTKTTHWLFSLSYLSNVGEADPYQIWQAMQDHRKYLFSGAGLLHLKDTRLNWLKYIPAKNWLQGGKQLSLSTMDWLRLLASETLLPPKKGSPEREATLAFMEELNTMQTDLPFDLSGFKSSLRSYQETGVKWLWFLHCHGLSGLLCDEMGLGKTHQAMGLVAACANASPEAKFLIVCPTSVIYHWEELLHNFLPSVETHIFHGSKRSLRQNTQILLTSYGIIRSEKELLSKIPFDVAIFDEIQIAKNAHSQTHKALKKMQAKMRLGLTGTPIENRLEELKALFDLVIPGYMPQEAQFKELFTIPIEKNQDHQQRSLLSRLIRPFILRRKKTDVLSELPEKTEEIAYCPLSEEQQKLYQHYFLEHKTALVETLRSSTKPVPHLHIFSLLTHLKQICDHPSLVLKDAPKKHQSGKWDLFVELLEEARGSNQKLVVFSQYLGMLDLIEAYLKEQQIGFAGIRGSTRDRKAQLTKFREDPTCEVFVASLQAAGVGVDLVSASVVIHYDRWWNPARENQATDRVHRIGQNRGVQVFKMVTKHTIEELIHKLIEKKKQLTEGILHFDDQDHIKGFNREELIELLEQIEKSLDVASD